MRFFFALLCTLTLLSAAPSEFDAEFTKTERVEVADPLSAYNEMMTSFNDVVYEYALKPTSKAYAYVVPKPLREGVSNVFDNLFFPIRFINNLLQFKFQNSAEELGRFVINSTLGFGGLVDVAHTEFGLKPHDEDFGQTLGYYGVGSGFHVVLPFLGPSNIRDIVGLGADTWANPVAYISARDELNLFDRKEDAWIASALLAVNKTSLRSDEYDSFKRDAIELYPFLRDFYESRRAKLIKE